MNKKELAPIKSVTSKERVIFENPNRGSSFEILDFEIPDLTIPKVEENIRRNFTFKVKNLEIPNLEVDIEITRFQPHGPGSILVMIDLIGVAKKEKIFSFSDVLFYKSAIPDDSSRTRKLDSLDKVEHTRWHSGHREVNKKFTGKGLGEFILLLREKLIKEISKKYPELKAEYMEVLTDIAAVANLLIDQQWLKDHGMTQFLKKYGKNLGYIPGPDEDPSKVEELLASKTSRLSEINRGKEGPIKFIKPL